MTRAWGMAVAATSVRPALRNVARGSAAGAVDAAGPVAASCRSTVCAAVARSGAAKQQALQQALQHLHQRCGGFLSPTSRRRFLQGGGAAVGGMLGMMSSVPPRAQAAEVSEAEEVLKNVQWPEQFPFSKEDFARYDE